MAVFIIMEPPVPLTITKYDAEVPEPTIYLHYRGLPVMWLDTTVPVWVRQYIDLRTKKPGAGEAGIALHPAPEEEPCLISTSC